MIKKNINPTPLYKLLDAQHIRRWNIVGTVIESNVAVHSYNVAMIAAEIFKQVGGARMWFDIPLLMMHALFHDADELEGGDIATPTKIAMRGAGYDFEALKTDEQKACFEEYKDIIKGADLIDNYLFIANYGVGSRAGEAETDAYDRLQMFMGTSSENLRNAMNDVLSAIIARRAT